MPLVVNTDRDQPHAESFEIVTVPRELAQFAHAIWSPIAAIKEQQHPVAALLGQPEIFSILIF